MTSAKAFVLNGFFFLFTFLAWVCCCVSFGGVLMTATEDHTDPNGNVVTSDLKFYWNRVHMVGGNDISFDDPVSCNADFCSKCNHGGKGLVAMQVFAFLQLIVVMPLTLIRIFGVQLSFLEPTRKVLLIELINTAVIAFWFFLSVCIYGGECYHNTKIHRNYDNVQGTGFGYIVVCFLFLLANIVIIYLVRADPACHFGTSAGSSSSYQAHNDDPNTTSYNPPQAYQHQYVADPQTQAYANTYNQPSTAHIDNNL